MTGLKMDGNNSLKRIQLDCSMAILTILKVLITSLKATLYPNDCSSFRVKAVRLICQLKISQFSAIPFLHLRNKLWTN